MSMLELAGLIRELAGSDSGIAYGDLPEDDPMQRQPDISLAKKLLDWEPVTPVREGLMKTIEYFRKL
jgi:nucleoside-diphosphate-sugar epimerase